MIYLLREQKVNVINSVLFDFYSKYPKPSRVTVSTDRQASAITQQVQTPPLIAGGWLVLCSVKVSPGAIKKLDSKDASNAVVVQAGSKADVNNLAAGLEGSSFKVIDNYVIDRQVMTSWVAEELSCGSEVAATLCNRVNYQTASVIRNVNLLKSLPYVGRGEVLRYVEKESRYSVSDLSSFLIGYEDLHGFSYEDAVQILHQFRYSYSWLVKKLLADVRLHLKIFSLISSGTLTRVNYQKFRKMSGDKDIRGLTDKALYRIISLFGEVSTEYLLHLEAMLAMLKGRPEEAYRLVTLFKTV